VEYLRLEYECEWLTESFSILKLEKNSACYYYWVECLHLDTWHATQALHLLPWFIEIEWKYFRSSYTNEEHMINEVSGLRLSDHVCLQFKVCLCYVEKCNRPIPRFNTKLIVTSLTVYLTQLNGMRLWGI